MELLPFHLDTIRPWNTHWAGAGVSPLVLHHEGVRAPVRFLVQNLLAPPQGQWEIVAGPRQIGKTTSLGHVARQLLRAGITPHQIAIAPFDQPLVQATMDEGLDALIMALSVVHPPRPDAPLFLLLDEVQELPRWSTALKAAWDRHRHTVRVLATGSSALGIIRPVQADFPGRIRVQTMHPMKFREVVLNHPRRGDHAPQEIWERLAETAKTVRSSIPKGDRSFQDAIRGLHELIHGSSTTLPAFLQSVFIEYCVWGGYPAARPGTDRDLVARREIFDQAWNAVLGRDLPATGVVKSREFTLFFQNLALNPGRKFVKHNIANQLDIRAETVMHWKRILEDALLVQQLPPRKTTMEPGKGKDKIYLTDPGWYTFLSGVHQASDVPDQVLGLLVETVLVDHARRLQYSLMGSSTFPLGYADKPEVDIAVSLGSRWLLLESKFRRHLKGNLPEAGRDQDLRICVTRDRFDVQSEGTPHHIPACEWALVC